MSRTQEASKLSQVRWRPTSAGVACRSTSTVKPTIKSQSYCCWLSTTLLNCRQQRILVVTIWLPGSTSTPMTQVSHFNQPFIDFTRGYSGNLNRNVVSWGLVNAKGLFSYSVSLPLPAAPATDRPFSPTPCGGRKRLDGQHYATALPRFKKAARLIPHRTFFAEESWSQSRGAEVASAAECVRND